MPTTQGSQIEVRTDLIKKELFSEQLLSVRFSLALKMSVNVIQINIVITTIVPMPVALYPIDDMWFEENGTTEKNERIEK